MNSINKETEILHGKGAHLNGRYTTKTKIVHQQWEGRQIIRRLLQVLENNLLELQGIRRNRKWIPNLNEYCLKD